MREYIDPLCEKLPALKGTSPSDDREYASFFHHLYAPFVAENTKRLTKDASKDKKLVFWIGGAIIGAIVLMAIIASMHSYPIYQLILAGLLFASVVAMVGFFMRLLGHGGKERLDLLQKLDEKLLKSTGGVEPPTYGANLAELLEKEKEIETEMFKHAGRI